MAMPPIPRLNNQNTIPPSEIDDGIILSEKANKASPYSDGSRKKTKSAPLQERRMIDRFRLWAKGGEGGNGCSSFRRSRHDRRGRPDGGNGGRGGDVILECSPAIWDFSSLQHHINAKRGGHGAPKNMIGSRGADKVVLVPVGTVIHLIEGELLAAIENDSSEPLDPWDLPGRLDFDGSETSQQSAADGSGNSEKLDNTTDDGLACLLKDPTPEPGSASSVEVSSRVSPFRYKSRVNLEAHKFWDEENITQRQYSDGTDFSGSESGAELGETEDIKYNVAELTEPGQRIIVARGGEGGLGNIHSGKGFKKVHGDGQANVELLDDNCQQASLSAGSPGSEVVLLLELKSIADVGLVGLPNAGKSTLLGAISRAKPRVGHYAFTTLRPNLGNLNYDDLSIRVADIPGLIRGAHENQGLGHAFLRHIERTRVLAYVVDLAAAIDGRKGIPPWEQLKDLILELESYHEGLSARPSLIVANKIDEAGAEQVYEELRRRVCDVPIFPVCAVLEEGVAEFEAGLKMLVSGEQIHSLKLDNIKLD